MKAMIERRIISNIIESRKSLVNDLRNSRFETEEEGGCGVTGFACSIPVRGKHIYEPSKQMHNRGNGRGGGIAAMGFDPRTLGVSNEIMEDDYILQIAVLEDGIITEVEDKFIKPFFNIDFSEKLSHVDDYRDIPGLDIKPPEVFRYFVRVKADVLNSFIKKNNFSALSKRQAEDEFIFQNSYNINKVFYNALGKQRAFVLSHGRNFFILKIVGYAERVVEYYKLEDFRANIWIAHQRYPTKGRVWHPAGAHPFIGMNEALVHNGDFANYHSVSEYLKQRNLFPQFLTDTEVSALLFDLYSRTYGYPLEYVIEALAPTMERDFDKLPEEKRNIYRTIQATHIHGSPDGPWFFIIARNDTANDRLQLIGITDTAMLRPQVFALHDGEVQLGLVCSEKQAIDATLKSIAADDPRVGTVADKYWNARGGSYTDGGAFIFNLEKNGKPGERKLTCADKFGSEVTIKQGQTPYVPDRAYYQMQDSKKEGFNISEFLQKNQPDKLYDFVRNHIKEWDYNNFMDCLKEIKDLALKNDHIEPAVEALTLLIDRHYPAYDKKRRSILQMVSHTLDALFGSIPSITDKDNKSEYKLINWETRGKLRVSANNENTLVIDASGFEPEGAECDSMLMNHAYDMGWRKFIIFGLKGQRFHGCGFGPDTHGVRIDIYGSSGDYTASGIDGMSIYIHGNAQDQLGQIMKSGKLVIYGDTGQTFMYGAKGGEVFILGNAAGRPLINAVGRPKVVINGTCLDYMAESFMAGDPLNGGGFVIMNGIAFDDDGKVVPLENPYPGSNLFSLASGGAIFVRDPHGLVDDHQLNGGEIVPLENRDWELILPFLKENEALFNISVENDLLMVDDSCKEPLSVYRKVRPKKAEKVEEDGLEEWGEGA